jgi:hypothetical protein
MAIRAERLKLLIVDTSTAIVDIINAIFAPISKFKDDHYQFLLILAFFVYIGSCGLLIIRELI